MRDFVMTPKAESPFWLFENIRSRGKLPTNSAISSGNMKSFNKRSFTFVLLLFVIWLFCTNGTVTSGTTLISEWQDEAEGSVRRTNHSSAGNVFLLRNPDFRRSPFSGMTRRHWIEAAVYMLQGAFGYVKTIEDSMNFPKQPGKSYPRQPSEEPTAKLEAFVRTLLIAAPLLAENPELKIGSLQVSDYYRRQMERIVDPNTDIYVRPRLSNEGRSQILVEFGGLSLSLFIIPDILWEPLSAEHRAALKDTMLSYGEGPTLNSNWRFFNILVLSFFKSRGYPVNDTWLEVCLNETLRDYVGKGWYADGDRYDYYSMWAFQLYGVLWSQYFGFKHYPKYAERFMANFEQLKDHYPHMFGRNGEMIMWGRSISYRFASVSPLPFTGYRNGSRTNYGWLRRIASGTLLQFLQHPKYLQDGVPTLGFYGAFEPAVQGYSCRASVYWAGKAFLGLLLPETNAYWNSIENEGPWPTMKSVSSKFEQSSKLLITNYPNIGASEIRGRCCYHDAYLGQTIYNRLAYHSAFPWQEDSPKGMVSMNYLVRTNASRIWQPIRCYSFKSYKAGIYQRSAELKTNTHKFKFYLAEVFLPNGVLRVDVMEGNEAAEVRLGHYALPDLGETIKHTSKLAKGKQRIHIISNGKYSLAMYGISGWKRILTKATQGLNPAASNSSIIMISDQYEPKKRQNLKVYVTLMLWKFANEEWTAAELEPIKSVEITPDSSVVIITMSGGTKHRIDTNK